MKFVNLWLLTLIFSLSTSVSGFGQGLRTVKKYKKKYKSFLNDGSKAIDAGTTYMVEKTKKKNFVRKVFNPDLNQITHYYTFAKRDLEILEGKAMEGAIGDGQKWYSTAALSSGINPNKQQAQVDGYHDYLLRKYTPVSHPLMQRYQLPALNFKPIHIFYALKEYLTGNKHDRRRMRRRFRNRNNVA